MPFYGALVNNGVDKSPKYRSDTPGLQDIYAKQVPVSSSAVNIQ